MAIHRMYSAILPLYMELLNSSERTFLQAVSHFSYCNPFLPEHTEFERAALGTEYVEGEPVWSQQVENPEKPRENVWRIAAKLEPLAEELRRRLRLGADRRAGDLILYEDAILHLLYQRFYPKFYAASFAGEVRPRMQWSFYREFLQDWRAFFEIDGVRFPSGHEPALTFSFFRQIQRAFEQIFLDVIGGSMQAARFRGAIWQ